jgi:hypothetical protein
VNRVTIAFSTLLIALGVGMVIRTALDHPGGLAYGYVAGAAFLGAGAARLYLATRSRA